MLDGSNTINVSVVSGLLTGGVLLKLSLKDMKIVVLRSKIGSLIKHSLPLSQYFVRIDILKNLNRKTINRNNKEIKPSFRSNGKCCGTV